MSQIVLIVTKQAVTGNPHRLAVPPSERLDEENVQAL